MPKFSLWFDVSVKVKADSEKQALKVAKELRNVALAAVKADGRSTAKASTIELLH